MTEKHKNIEYIIYDQLNIQQKYIIMFRNELCVLSFFFLLTGTFVVFQSKHTVSKYSSFSKDKQILNIINI